MRACDRCFLPFTWLLASAVSVRRLMRRSNFASRCWCCMGSPALLRTVLQWLSARSSATSAPPFAPIALSRRSQGRRQYADAAALANLSVSFSVACSDSSLEVSATPDRQAASAISVIAFQCRTTGSAWCSSLSFRPARLCHRPDRDRGSDNWLWNWEHVRHLILRRSPCRSFRWVIARTCAPRRRNPVAGIHRRPEGKGIVVLGVSSLVRCGAHRSGGDGYSARLIAWRLILIETVFSWPAQAAPQCAIFQRDLPLLQGLLVLASFFVVLTCSSTWCRPR